MEMFLIPRERGHNADGLWGHIELDLILASSYWLWILAIYFNFESEFPTTSNEDNNTYLLEFPRVGFQMEHHFFYHH